MIDLRKYITEGDEPAISKLIKAVLKHTTANTLDHFEALGAYNEEVLYSVGSELVGETFFGWELEDYSTWGDQYSNTAGVEFGLMNPLLYALIASVFPESAFEAYGCHDCSLAMVERVLDYENDPYVMEWQIPVYEQLKEYYLHVLGGNKKAACEEFSEDLGGSLIMIHFKEECDIDLVERLMSFFDFGEADDTYFSDIVENDGSYSSGIPMYGILENAAELAEFIEKHGINSKTLTDRSIRTAERMGEALEQESPNSTAIIAALMSLRHSEELIIL